MKGAILEVTPLLDADTHAFGAIDEC